ncbi:MAG TPA: hypothetical protein VGX96_07675 [Candidatus Elarobacter sp.]|nr:hypothetical protein [Candidatus Elarobacter sp.]
MEWQLAHVVDGSLAAYSDDKTLELRATVVAPNPGYEARIVTADDSGLSGFQVHCREKPGVWTDTVTEIAVVQQFAAGNDAEETKVTTADGDRKVRIIHLDKPIGDEAATAAIQNEIVFN